MTHESAHQYTTQINRHIGRVMRLTLDHRKSNMPIQILTNYAPRNGHTVEDRKQHWADVKEILNKTCKDT